MKTTEHERTEMTDREMLEMAARAAGKTIDQETFGEYQDTHRGMVVADGEHWTPLIDDGNALRAEVERLRAEVERLRKGPHHAITHCDGCGCDWIDNGLNPVGCPYCELRREVERRQEGNRRAAQEYVEIMRGALREAAQICKDLDEEALAKEGRLACGTECAAAIAELAAAIAELAARNG